MANNDYKVNVDRLEGPEDWAKWKWHISMVLRSHGLEDVINGIRQPVELPTEPTNEQKAAYAAWQKDDAKGASLIASALSKPVAELVLTCNNAKEIWDKLCARFERSSTQRLNMLIESFFRVKRDETEDISTHVAKLQKLFVDLNDELTKHEENSLSERMLNGRILSTLGKEYDNFKDLWDTIPSKSQNLNLLIEKLCTIELRDQSITETTALVVSGESKYFKKQPKKGNFRKQRLSMERAKQKFPCNICKLLGHWAAECPRKNKGDSTNKQLNKQQNSYSTFISHVMGASIGNYIDANKWYCDSGASKHITPNKQYFSSYRKFVVPEVISLGKQNVCMYAYGQGTVKIQVRRNSTWNNAEMKNVLYVPDASVHLFSVKAAALNGFSTTIDDRSVKIREKGSKITVMTGYVNNGLYVLNLRVVKSKKTVQVNLVTPSDTLQIFHERFGHQNKQHVKNVLKRMDINVDSCKEEFCDGCAVGKMHRLPFRQRMNRPTVTGELIHADVNGPMNTKSFGGARYYVCFKDDFSKYRRIFFLKQKSEVHTVLEQFLNEAQTNGHVVKKLRCDGGKEFDNSRVAKLLASRGIEQCIPPPYTPEQNGGAERENRTIVEAARSMLNPSKLPKGLWAEACNTAAYLLNRTGKSSVQNKVPYELWYGHPVGRLDHLRIFGTRCYVHVNKKFRSKFDNKAVLGHLVGYVNDKDGFRVWIPSQRKLVMSHDVKFQPEVVCNLRDDGVKFEVSRGVVQSQYQYSWSSETEEEPKEEGYQEIQSQCEPEESVMASSSGGSQDFSDCEKKQEAIYEESEVEVPINQNKRKLRKPAWIESDEFLMMTGISQGECKDPNSLSEAMKSNEKELWLQAIDEELESLKQNDTWVLVERPKNVQVLQNRWVLRQKSASNGNTRFKARLVAKGYSQRSGIDYKETFSPVARYDTIRTLLALAAAEKMQLAQFDIKTAFLNGILEEVVYLEQPEGFEDGTDRVCLLKRSLYGLKQAPRCWNKRFIGFMKKTGFQNSVADPCLFYRKRNKSRLYVAIYVDDGLIVGSDKKEITSFLKIIQEEFSMTTGSLDNYLGLKIEQRKDGSIAVSQENYTRRILERFRMAESNAISTPVGREESDRDEVLSSEIPYREAVGCLMYLTTASRPDIAFAVNKAARAMEKPTVQDWNQIKRIFRYLRGTVDYGIIYSKAEELKVYSDADFAGDKRTRRSTTGIVAIFSGGPISWTSQLQKVVATSTTEAEIISASEGAKELVWLKRLLSELIEMPGEVLPTLYVDNASAIKLAKNPEYHRRSKHIEVRHFYVRERFLNGELKLEHIDGKDQLADLLTKPLERIRFELLRKNINICQAT